MHIWILSRDASFLKSDENKNVENTIERHLDYYNKIKLSDRSAELYVFVFSSSCKNFVELEIAKGFIIKRINPSSIGILSFILMTLKNHNKRPGLITTQTPFLDGLIGLFFGRILGASTMIQLHFDITSKDWRAERALNYLLYRLGRYVLKKSSSIRTVSNNLKDKLINKLGIDGNKIYVTPVSIDRNFTQDKWVEKSSSNFYKIYGVGRLVKTKDFNLFLKIAAQFKTEKKFNFIIVGDGPEKDSLIQEAHRLGLNNVEFTGYIEPEKLNYFYRQADLVLVTSLHEGYCRVVEEALKFGVPVISSACTGPEDMIINAKNGYIIDSRSPSKYEEKIRDITISRVVHAQFARTAFASNPRAQYKYNDFGDLLSQQKCV